MPIGQRIRKLVRGFLRPTWSRGYVLRLVVVTLVAFITFKFILGPAYIHGESMEPTYHNGTALLYLRLTYLFGEPQVGDVVVIRYAGDRVMLLKRVVGLAGDTVSIVNGRLYRNGEPQEEPYVAYRDESWMLPPRQIQPGNIYVIGDNRGMPMREHRFGETEASRIAGSPLW